MRNGGHYVKRNKPEIERQIYELMWNLKISQKLRVKGLLPESGESGEGQKGHSASQMGGKSTDNLLPSAIAVTTNSQLCISGSQRRF